MSLRGPRGSLSLLHKRMIDKQFISSAVADAISGTDIFIVDVEIDADDNIVVLLDSPGLLDLDEVSEISRKVNASIEAADPAYNYSLELGSAGLTSPLKVRGQYEKNVGNAVEVMTADGRKLRGVIAAVSDAGEPLAFTLEREEKVREPGAKRPVVKTVAESFDVPAGVRSVTPVIDFK